MKLPLITIMAVISILSSGCKSDEVGALSPMAQKPVPSTPIATISATNASRGNTARKFIEDASRIPALDGRWACRADADDHPAVKLEIAGNVLRDPVTEKTMVLTHNKGIQLGMLLTSYRDADSGQVIHARTMTQVDKPGVASIFSAAVNGGAGAGVEFLLNPNDTLKISDYSSMTGADSVAQMVVMTCSRDRA